MASKANWTINDIPDQTGRVAIVTGANSGIGFYASQALAAKGAHVILACRSFERGKEAQATIAKDVPSASLETLPLDLADLSSIREFVGKFAEKFPALDLLINNAGVMAIPFRRTADGFEMQFGVNHLGHFALTGLLLEKILAAKASRVVTVSSGAHLFGRIRFDDLNSEKSYLSWAAYAQSKLANLLFAYELQRRLERIGSGTISLACHPGYAATNLQKRGPEMRNNPLMGGFMNVANRVFAQSAEMGALPTLYAAISPEAKGCDYIGPGGLMGQRGYPVKMRSNQASYNPEHAARLWKISEELTGVHYTALQTPQE